jgi:hypothetical protein
MTTSTKPTLEDLRKPFPAGSVGLLPKPTRKENAKGNCNVCKTYHGLPAVHLDYVGHANITDRLLSVDPEWNWEPAAYTEQGLPLVDREGNLWIKLTVLGVTRLGVGDGFSLKEKIGDALRNASMRFGVALSLWTKDELESGYLEDKPAQAPQDADDEPTTEEPPPAPARTRGRKAAAQGDGLKEAAQKAAQPPSPEPPPHVRLPEEGITDMQIDAVWKTGRKLHWDESTTLYEVSDFLGKTVTDLSTLTFDEARRVIPHLNSKKNEENQ